MFPHLAALSLLATVLARAPHQRPDQGQHHAVTYTNYYEVPTDGGTITISHHDCTAPRRNNNGNRHVDVHEVEDDVHHRPGAVYTNERRRYSNTKYIEEISNDTERGGLVLHDNIKYEETPPYTNADPRDGTGAGARPGPALQTEPPRTTVASAHGGPQTRPTPSANGTTTEADFNLEDRVAFSGDPCATGYVKVNGKCVEIQE